MPYSVPPRVKLRIVGLKPSWNFSTRMPTRLAARKWPSSCTNTSTPRTKANDKIVMITGTSDLQFYPAGDIQRIVARPLVGRADIGQGGHRPGVVGIHRALDDLWDRGEPDAPVEA